MIIAIIDKYPIIRSGMRLFIKNRFADATCLESKSIDDFHNKYPEERPEIIIIALSQGVLVSNLEVIGVTKVWYDMRTVIFYDEQTDLSMISYYFQTGIRYYLSKKSDLDELVECISNVLSGKHYIDLECRLPGEMYPLLVSGVLTTKEYEIARYLSEGRRTSWIAKELGLKTSTISTIKARIFRKLRIENVLQLRDILN